MLLVATRICSSTSEFRRNFKKAIPHDLIEKTDEEETLSSYDSYFYITDSSLGLVTFVSRYYTCIEAEFSDLGITEF